MKKLLLEIQLVPSTCFFSNVRSAVSKSQWDTIRHRVYDQAWGVCQICGIAPEQSLEAHEIWFYDESKLIQKLVGMIALCKNCHEVKHFGFASINGRAEQALTHLKKVNKLSDNQAKKYLEKAFALWEERSQNNWILDISHLTEYGIDISKIKGRK